MSAAGQGEERTFAAVPPGERLLLLPHCLRPSAACPGRPSRDGFQCPPDCRQACAIGRLRRAAEAAGYKGVCVAPGGSLALRFIKELRPQAILAIACHKELAEGVEAVAELDGPRPAVLTLPLLRDGCVDTEVSVEEALRLVQLGTDVDAGRPQS
ncbi:MAG: DUF116 domain-containing protein [Candidatus Bipolaricaulaceae bacterium]